MIRAMDKWLGSYLAQKLRAQAIARRRPAAYLPGRCPIISSRGGPIPARNRPWPGWRPGSETCRGWWTVWPTAGASRPSTTFFTLSRITGPGSWTASQPCAPRAWARWRCICTTTVNQRRTEDLLSFWAQTLHQEHGLLAQRPEHRPNRLRLCSRQLGPGQFPARRHLVRPQRRNKHPGPHGVLRRLHHASAPDVTQTRTINAIYYATDDPDKPKSHDTASWPRSGGLLPATCCWSRAFWA